MTDIDAFSLIYRAKLDEAEVAGSVPENLTLEVCAFSVNILPPVSSFSCTVMGAEGLLCPTCPINICLLKGFE